MWGKERTPNETILPHGASLYLHEVCLQGFAFSSPLGLLYTKSVWTKQGFAPKRTSEGAYPKESDLQTGH